MSALEQLGQEVGAKVALKRRAVDKGDFEGANSYKREIEQERDEIYRHYDISRLLALRGTANRAAEEHQGEDLPPIRRKKPLGSSSANSPRYYLTICCTHLWWWWWCPGCLSPSLSLSLSGFLHAFICNFWWCCSALDPTLWIVCVTTCASCCRPLHRESSLAGRSRAPTIKQ